MTERPREVAARAITPEVAITPDTEVAEEPTAQIAIEEALKKAREPAANPASKERIVIFALGRPLIVEFRLVIDGQPHTAALERLVEEVLELADEDDDGRVMWKELCASKRIKYGQYGNLAIDNENSEKQVIERYDIASDGVVDRAELPRFLTRNAGSSRPFSVRGTLSYRNASRRSAPTWMAIDADEDGRLSNEEMSLAASRLAGRDGDDDEIVLEADLRRDDPPDMMGMMERRRGLEAARLLGEHADWSSVQQALEHQYGGGRFLRTGAFPNAPELFEVLDGNKDGRLGRDEYRGLNGVAPHVVIGVEFGKADEGQIPPTLTLVQLNNEGASDVSSSSQPGLITLPLGSSIVTFYTNDTVAREDFSQRATQALTMFDQNKDGYLEASELPETLQNQFGRFEAVDADEDGKVFPKEIEAFLTQQQAGLRAQIHTRVSDQEDVVFTLLDVDGDRRLISRELQSAGERLAVLDRDQSGDVSADELPEVLLVAVARGSIEAPEQTFAMTRATGRGPDKDAPRWFAAMDANQDGEVSRREFLGTPEQFVGLDASGDGLLQVGELGANGAN